MNKYEIGLISLDPNGVWWVQWMGEHASQGGIEFTPGNMGSDDLKELLNIVSGNMLRCKERYLEQINQKEGDKDDNA